MITIITTNIFAAGAIATFGLQFAGFVVAAILQTEIFYDILGGINYLLLTWLFYPDSEASTKTTYFRICQILSRGWLLVFLAWRAHSRKGDSRFDGVKNNPPVFFVYWMVQACWVYLISLPLLVIYEEEEEGMADGSNTHLPTTDVFLLVGFALSILLEISSDIQKTLWVERGRKGTFCQEGWWAYSRHPNYAGEIMQWWFAAALAGTSFYCVAFTSPLFTMHILLNTKGTGIWHAEGKNLRRYLDSENGEEYKQYRRDTSPLFPMVGYGTLPLPVKRWIFFEWERFEYRPPKEETKES